MSISIEVEGIAGSSIDQVAKETTQLALKLNIMVTASFNGFHLIAVSGKSPDAIVAEYHSWVKRDLGTV